MDKASGRAAGPGAMTHRPALRNMVGAIALVVLAFAPQLLALLFWVARALLAIVPGSDALFGPFASGPAFGIVANLC